MKRSGVPATRCRAHFYPACVRVECQKLGVGVASDATASGFPSASAGRAALLLLLEPLQLDLLLVELVLQRLELLITLRRRWLLQPLLIELLLLLVQTKLERPQLLRRRTRRLRKGDDGERGSHEGKEALHETYVGMAEAGNQPTRPGESTSRSAGDRVAKPSGVQIVSMARCCSAR